MGKNIICMKSALYNVLRFFLLQGVPRICEERRRTLSQKQSTDILREKSNLSIGNGLRCTK